MTSQPHSARLAIAPDSEAEVAGVLRALMRQPWLVAGRDGALIDAVLRGWADAVAGSAGVTPAMAADWLGARQAATAALAIGHRDVYARPG